MESGYHSALWFDLDGLFAQPASTEPFVLAASEVLRQYEIDVVCGPLLGGALLAHQLADLLGTKFWYTEPVKASEGAGLYRARYRLPHAFSNSRAGTRVALVDDVMSAGSSLRASFTALHELGATVVVVGTLLMLGTVGQQYFAQQNVPTHAVVCDEFDVWPPERCPLCAAGSPLERVAGQQAHAGPDDAAR